MTVAGHGLAVEHEGQRLEAGLGREGLDRQRDELGLGLVLVVDPALDLDDLVLDQQLLVVLVEGREAHASRPMPSRPSMVTKAISSPDFLVVMRFTVLTMPTMVVMVPSGTSLNCEMRWPASRRTWCRMSFSGCELT